MAGDHGREGATLRIEFEIENTFAVLNLGVFVGARLLDASICFELSETPCLGGVTIERWVEVPRKLDADGKQRLDYFVFKLVRPEDREQLRAGERAFLV